MLVYAKKINYTVSNFNTFYRIDTMSEGKKPGLIKRFLKAFLFSPVNLIFAVATAFFAAKAYMWEPTWMNKLIFFGVAGLWVFWIVARYMVVLFIVAALLGGGYYMYYQYSTREIRKCEQSGGIWNKETKTCEEKVSIIDKAINQFNKLFGNEKDKTVESQNTNASQASAENNDVSKVLDGALTKIGNMLFGDNNKIEQTSSDKPIFEEDDDEEDEEE